MKARFRRFLALPLSVLLVFLAGCGGSTPTQQQPAAPTQESSQGSGAATEGPASLGTIKVGLAMNTTFRYITPYVGVGRGTWTKRGLEVQVEPFQGDGAMQQALAAGSIDVGLGSAVGATGAMLKGVKTKIVAQLGKDLTPMTLFVTKESGVTKLEDLAGKTLGISTPGSLTDLLTMYTAKHIGVDPEDGIKRLPLGGLDNLLAAVKAGQIDGFISTADVTYTAESQGLGTVIFSYGELLPHFTFETVVVPEKMIAEKPDVVEVFLEGLFEAVELLGNERDYTVQLLEEKMNFSQDIGRRVWDLDSKNLVPDGRIDPEGMDAVAQALVDVGTAETLPDWRAFVDERFLPVSFK